MAEPIKVHTQYDKNHTPIPNLFIEPIESSAWEVQSEGAWSYYKGKVIGMGNNSEIPFGSEVIYWSEINEKGELRQPININGKECYQIAEAMVIVVNGQPFQRLLVAPLDGDNAILAPDSTLSMPQRGVVRYAPENSYYKVGDNVLFRKNEQQMYPNQFMGGELLQVVFYHDIFMVNNSISPYKAMVQINIAERNMKFASIHGGIEISPEHQHMLYYLQYGKIVAIGREAKNLYPELNKGDIAILHHGVEHDNYRVVNIEYGKHGNPLYAYLILHCKNDNFAREIFGKIRTHKQEGKLHHTIIPFGDNVFLKYHFDLLEDNIEGRPEGLERSELSLHEYHDKDSLSQAVSEKVKGINQIYEKERNRLDLICNMTQDIDEKYKLREEIDTKRKISGGIINILKKNHLVVCTQVAPKVIPSKVVTDYQTLYPIYLLGTKYLITNKNFIVATHAKHKDMVALKAQGNKVFVKPIIEETDSDIIAPDSVTITPNKGIIYSIGEGCERDDVFAKAGDTILFPQGRFHSITINGETLIMMTAKEVAAVIDTID